jgi:putative ABC transport system permease protein
VTAALDLESAGYEEARARTMMRTLNDRMATVPGVEAVAYGRVLPLSMNTSGYEISIPGHTPPGGKAGDEFAVDANVVDEGYLDALRIPLLRGRDFARTDDMAAPRVAIVNERFVRRFFPNGDGVGATFRMDSSLVTIVGVARDARFAKLDEEPTPFLFLPNAQVWQSAGNLLIQTTGALEAASAALLREFATLDPSLPPPRITTMRQATAVVLLPQRVAAAVTGALGLVGLLLAAVGLYGVLAFSTAQRTREIGVRLALGASRGGIMRLVLGDGVRLAGAGVAVGLMLAFLATRALRPFLFGVNPMDPLTFVAMSATLGGVAMLATWLPARRAARVDPMRSMREE